ncbi:MAG: putative nuclease of the RNAse H fold, HicB family [Chloroflexi bacterium]|jgi:predicted RNase H-like HicB family nuclease|nr:MAG: putative nuclease of the RNAse H fold, HicB family [Chloroflexota bacterium]
MQSIKTLGPSRKIVLEKLRKNPGVGYERSGEAIRLLAKEHGLSPLTLDAALWEVASKGFIARERVGRRVQYYYPAESQALPGRASRDNGGASARYTVTYVRDEDGYIVASVGALQGCHSQGRTLEEAKRNIREAMRGYLASMQYHGERVPTEEEAEPVEVLF